MSYLLLLIIFYQPIYWLGHYLVNKLRNNTTDSADYLTKVKNWFSTLWSLLTPNGL